MVALPSRYALHPSRHGTHPVGYFECIANRPKSQLRSGGICVVGVFAGGLRQRLLQKAPSRRHRTRNPVLSARTRASSPLPQGVSIVRSCQLSLRASRLELLTSGPSFLAFLDLGRQLGFGSRQAAGDPLPGLLWSVQVSPLPTILLQLPAAPCRWDSSRTRAQLR